MQRASAKQCNKIRVSYGVMRQTMAFLLPLEVIWLQATGKFFYDVAVSRVQTVLKSHIPAHFTWPDNGNMTYNIVSVTRDQPSIISQSRQNFVIFKWQSIQVGKDIFQVNENFLQTSRILRHTDDKSGTFKVSNMATSQIRCVAFSLCKLAHRYIF